MNKELRPIVAGTLTGFVILLGCVVWTHSVTEKRRVSRFEIVDTDIIHDKVIRRWVWTGAEAQSAFNFIDVDQSWCFGQLVADTMGTHQLTIRVSKAGYKKSVRDVSLVSGRITNEEKGCDNILTPQSLSDIRALLAKTPPIVN